MKNLTSIIFYKVNILYFFYIFIYLFIQDFQESSSPLKILKRKNQEANNNNTSVFLDENPLMKNSFEKLKSIIKQKIFVYFY